MASGGFSKIIKSPYFVAGLSAVLLVASIPLILLITSQTAQEPTGDDGDPNTVTPDDADAGSDCNLSNFVAAIRDAETGEAYTTSATTGEVTFYRNQTIEFTGLGNQGQDYLITLGEQNAQNKVVANCKATPGGEPENVGETCTAVRSLEGLSKDRYYLRAFTFQAGVSGGLPEKCTEVIKVNLLDAPECGNGVVEEGEECDGAAVDGRSCQSDCKLEPLATCGNGVVENGEQCDGNVCSNGGACSNSCVCQQPLPETAITDNPGHLAAIVGVILLLGAEAIFIIRIVKDLKIESEA